MMIMKAGSVDPFTRFPYVSLICECDESKELILISVMSICAMSFACGSADELSR